MSEKFWISWVHLVNLGFGGRLSDVRLVENVIGRRKIADIFGVLAEVLEVYSVDMTANTSILAFIAGIPN